MSLHRFCLSGVAAVLAAVVPGGPVAHASAAAGWGWPLPPPHVVTRGLDLPDQRWQPGHRGVDLAARTGAVVRAAGDGVVRFAGRVAGVGIVSVQHPDGLLTTYQPLRPSVRRGQHVRLGQPIGRLVLRGSHCLPQACLHWGLRRGEDYLDPLALVAAARLRLLPRGDTHRGGPAGLAPAGSAALAAAVAFRRGRREAKRRGRLQKS